MDEHRQQIGAAPLADLNEELNIMQALDALELPPAFCTADTVRRQYRQLAKQYHPDNSRTGDADRFEAVQKAWEFLSVNFDNTGSVEPHADHVHMTGRNGGWSAPFAREFRYEAENYAPPSRDLNPEVEEVRKALAKRPIDYEGLLLRAEWLEHNLTDGSMDGTELLEILGKVQDIRGRVKKAEKRVRFIAGRIGAAEKQVEACRDLAGELKDRTLFGKEDIPGKKDVFKKEDIPGREDTFEEKNVFDSDDGKRFLEGTESFRARASAGLADFFDSIRGRAALAKEYRELEKKTEQCLAQVERYRKDLFLLERFCRESVNCPALLEEVQHEQTRLEELLHSSEGSKGKRCSPK